MVYYVPIASEHIMPFKDLSNHLCERHFVKPAGDDRSLHCVVNCFDGRHRENERRDKRYSDDRYPRINLPQGRAKDL